MQVKKQKEKPCMEQLTVSGLRREFDKVVYCNPVYLIYIMQSARLYELQAGIKITRKYQQPQICR